MDVSLIGLITFWNHVEWTSVSETQYNVFWIQVLSFFLHYAHLQFSLFCMIRNHEQLYHISFLLNSYVMGCFFFFLKLLTYLSSHLFSILKSPSHLIVACMVNLPHLWPFLCFSVLFQVLLEVFLQREGQKANSRVAHEAWIYAVP